MSTTLMNGNTMAPNQYIIVKLTPDMKNYTAWVVTPGQDHIAFANGLPVEPNEATRSTSASTMGTDIGNTLPTLST